EGKTIGAFSFHSDEVREPEERLLQAMNVIGSQIGQFLQRKQAEDVVRESEERFRSLTELSSDMYWEQDEQHRFTKLSGMDTERLGSGQRRMLGKHRWDCDYFNMTQADWA